MEKNIEADGRRKEDGLALALAAATRCALWQRDV